MTPAVLQLDKNNITYRLHQYHHDESAPSYGLEAAEKLNVDSQLIFKTLVVENEKGDLAVGIVPVEKQLNLKAMAKCLKCKKLTMADAKRAQSSTGYVLGGVSPLGQKKRLVTVIDSSAKDLKQLFISGGKRGLEIEMDPNHLAHLVSASFSPIAC